MACVEREVLELVALVDEDMVYPHAAEVEYFLVLSVLQLVAHGFKPGIEIFLALDKSFAHILCDACALFLQNFQVLFNGVKLGLQDFLLQVARLRYHSELFVRHYDTVVVVVLHIAEELQPVGCGKRLLVGI